MKDIEMKTVCEIEENIIKTIRENDINPLDGLTLSALALRRVIESICRPISIDPNNVTAFICGSIIPASQFKNLLNINTPSNGCGCAK